ncbi:nudC domain-containing protein 1-like [Sycon ciliatum]|uniref:nudC domain-containing protein 1-like n=1 Tax=Sycon ciliatum TaxID=27933 RepID=UPI0031F6E949
MGLRPDRSLVNSNFEGYRLSNSELHSIIESQLSCKPQCIQLSEKYYSYQLVRTFSTWNYLVQDPFSDGLSSYFIDSDFNVVHCSVDEGSVSTTAVLSIPKPPLIDSSRQCCPPAIIFCSLQTAVISDGHGNLFLVSLARDSGNGKCQWSISHSYSHGRPLFLFDCMECLDGSLQCAVVVFDEVDASTSVSTTTAATANASSGAGGIAGGTGDSGQCRFTLQWLALQPAVVDNVTTLNLLVCSEFSSRSIPFYASLTSDGSNVLCVLNEGRLQHTANGNSRDSSQGTLTSSTANDTAMEESNAPDGQTPSCPQTTQQWEQTSDLVTVSFNVDKDVRSRDIHFSLSSSGEISLGLKDGESFLRGNLSERVDNEGSAWTIENHVLELCLAKYQVGKQWSAILKNPNSASDSSVSAFPLRSVENLTAGEKEKILRQMEHMTSDKMVTDDDLAEQGHMLHQELEECDKAVDDDVRYLMCYSKDGRLLQQTNVTSYQWLFNARLASSRMPAVCLRYDVDACVWHTASSAGDVPTTPPHPVPMYRHVATFNALGYVAASKQQKKFMTCPSDASYSVICEYARNIFVYYPAPEASAGTPANTALQSIFSLPSPDESILGVVAMAKQRVLVLTDSHVYLLTF